jgi:UDP-N-acetylglucosamine transferase subunit ALG13
VILVSVGSQAPFDRLIRAVDAWATSRKRSDVFAQIAKGTYRPQYIKFTEFVDPSEFKQLVADAQVLVAHAGMGSILTAMELGKPVVVMPRRACFRETRNDHQVAAAKHFSELGRVIVADDEEVLPEKLDYALTTAETERISPVASPHLIATIKDFIENETASRKRYFTIRSAPKRD